MGWCSGVSLAFIVVYTKNCFYVFIKHVVIRSVLAFVNVKANSRKICEEMSFPFFLKNTVVSIFLFRHKTCVNYPHFSSQRSTFFAWS